VETDAKFVIRWERDSAMQRSKSIQRMLTGGNRRSLGRAAEVLELVRAQPERLGELVELLWDSDEVVRMRAADCLEKLSLEPEFDLRSYSAELLGLMSESSQSEVRWHLALMAPRLQLSRVEIRRAAAILEGYLEDRSSIVKTCAMQGLWELSLQDSGLRSQVLELVRRAARDGTAAMRARGRKLLAESQAD
jgi:hypothetical protein